MNIIENINERLSLADEDFAGGGEQTVAQLIEKSPIKLPEDYIEFLKRISGGEKGGIEFSVDGNIRMSICIWDAHMAIQNYEDNREFMAFLNDLWDKIWLIGTDLGDLVYFYGEGKDGFGLYRDETGSLSVEGADKIADTLTDFLVNGTGIDAAISL